MNPDRAGRIPPPTRRLVVRKANSHRDLRPITERVGFHVVFIAFVHCDKHVLFTINATVVVCSLL
jgi:ribosomal protein S16